MYQWLLVRRYLLSKIMPLLAALAVLLCTAMVLVTWSVMGGFLDMLLKSGRTMTGDVIVEWPNTGFAHYDDLVRRLEADPMVAGAAPVLETYGLLGLPNDRTQMVFVRGIDGASYGRVSAFDEILWWRPMPRPLPRDKDRLDPRLQPSLEPDLRQYLENGRSLSRLTPSGKAQPAVVMGIEVTGFNSRTEAGAYQPRQFSVRSQDGSIVGVDQFMPRDGEVTLSVLPLDSTGRMIGEQATRKLPVANEFHSGVYEADSRVVLVNLALLQEMLRMNAVKAPAPGQGPGGEDGFATGISTPTKDTPARVTHVYVRGKGDLSTLGAAEDLRVRVREIYAQFAQAHRGEVPDEMDILVYTWEDLNRTMIAAVQKETGLVLFLFSFISLVAVFLVLAIFWSMIAEKTKDIGILRALGASTWGVAGVWLAYGLAIGIVGALLGGLVAWQIVRNINPIHEWLGRALGLVIWDPRIYYFTQIPSKVDPIKAAIVVSGGMLSAVVGAIIPAWRAARMNPVKALRFE